MPLYIGLKLNQKIEAAREAVTSLQSPVTTRCYKPKGSD